MKPPRVPTVVLPAATKPVRAKKPTKAKVRAKKQAKPARTIGAPPVDMSPPDIRDSRPKHKAKPEAAVVHDFRLGEPGALDQAAPPARPSPPAIQPPAREVKLTGRLVQGQSCIWLGDLGEAIDNANGQPVCPYCGGFLLNVPDPEIVRLGIVAYELGAYKPASGHPKPHPGYKDFIDWTRQQKKCWPAIELAALDYFNATGKKVEP